ncbi:hypothetical protein [Catenulispora subtropica]|uniref:Uncharacterized protein n=1 Tax=Catenulispora subtropica TaxID=450798 RepID=A0ABN2R811_9ACTN
MRQLAITVQQTLWDARRCLRVARREGDVAQIALQEARLAYLTELAVEYRIPATLAAARGTVGRR